MRASTRRTLMVMAAMLPACNANQDHASSSQPDDPIPRTVEVAAGSATQPATSHATTTAAAPAATLALSGEGLDLVDPISGSTRHLPFDGDADAVVAAVTRISGAPSQRAVNGECGAGPMEFVTWNDGLSVLIQQQGFRGWSMNQRPGNAALPLTTISGIGLGSTRSALEAVTVITVSETSLGTEFSAAGLNGLFAPAMADAPIIAMWSGVSCVFR